MKKLRSVQTPLKALRFVESHGIVLESARGPVPNLAEAIAGEQIRGSWRGRPKGNLIYMLTTEVRSSGDVLVCRLIDGKVTFVHHRIWPAIVRMASELNRARIAAISETHGGGAHRVVTVEYPGWVPAETRTLARRISIDEALRMLGAAAPHRN
jgi:hypothetical protein